MKLLQLKSSVSRALGMSGGDGPVKDHTPGVNGARPPRRLILGEELEGLHEPRQRATRVDRRANDHLRRGEVVQHEPGRPPHRDLNRHRAC